MSLSCRWRTGELETLFIENSIIEVDQQVIIDKLDNKTLLKVLNEWFETTLKISSTIENGILFTITVIGLTLGSFPRMQNSIDFWIISRLTKYIEYSATKKRRNVLESNETSLVFQVSLHWRDTRVSMNESLHVRRDPVHLIITQRSAN